MMMPAPMVVMMMATMLATLAMMVVMVVFCQQRWWSRRQWWERSSTAGTYILYAIYFQYIICYIHYILYVLYTTLLLIVHGMAGEPSMLGLSRQISQFRCVLAQMLFKNKSKMVKIIFPEWDCSPHQQAPCHHGVHHLGAS